MTTLTSPRALSLTQQPVTRPQVTDLRTLLAEAGEDGLLRNHRRLLAVSHHTTAGFPDRVLRRRLGDDRARLDTYLEALAGLFPPEAGYHHDRLQLRDELSSEQKETEPLNADAHLSFIGGGFTNCAEFAAGPGGPLEERPLWFVDFDGVYRDRDNTEIRRTRRTTFVGYNGEERVASAELEVPVPRGRVALDLASDLVSTDPSGGPTIPAGALLQPILEAISTHGVTHGRIQLHLHPEERGAGLTVNEFEALLMTRDLVELFESPLRWAAARQAGNALLSALRALRISRERRERLRDRVLARPTPRILRLRRDLRLPLLPDGPPGAPARPVQGRYQSPILVQWDPAPAGVRRVRATLWRFR
ncbi:MAG: hypothetical protein EA352_05255 [Gemmatimonadales bacterium]|nr:MAG: hypothetical protein EA352_05255 [Gemmatimonadales bacterium]